jgi:hypothetical protein
MYQPQPCLVVGCVCWVGADGVYALSVCVMMCVCFQAVESKQVAEQDAERARFVVLKAEQVRAARCRIAAVGDMLWCNRPQQCSSR